jgi:hypothetical protein
MSYSLNDGQFPHTSQIRSLSIYSTWWTPHVILSVSSSSFLLYAFAQAGRPSAPPPLQPAVLPPHWQAAPLTLADFPARAQARRPRPRWSTAL